MHPFFNFLRVVIADNHVELRVEIADDVAICNPNLGQLATMQ